mgnify:CR=1 FL=1
MGEIAENYRRLRQEIPDEVEIVAAAKTRSPAEIRQAMDAGVSAIGQNYVQEAEAAFDLLGERATDVEWHLIGHLQRNKVNRSLPLFDTIQSLDSRRLARALDKRAEGPVKVFAQVNIAGEESKYGIAPEETRAFLEDVSGLENLCIQGLMTMEPYFEEPERARPYFQRMKRLFDSLCEEALPNVELDILSMGMSNSYRVAIEEGANMVRLGTAIFGPREH